MFYPIVKPFLLFRKILSPLRRWPRAARHQRGLVQDETRVVPVWVGSQLSGYPLVVRKRTRTAAQFYDEWE
ncbi:MAG: hypothetical protein IT582_07605 [Opitutaceae bacterium]|nr:hypothetical protein [Opitutaceae bacterium]